MIIIVRTLLLCFCVVFSSSAFSSSPEKLTELYYQYLKNNDWENLSSIMHEDALKEFKQSLLPVFEREAARKQSLLLERIYGKGATLDQAKKASDKSFFQRAIQNVAGLMKNTQYKLHNSRVLGKVAEGNDIVHVMVKETATAGSYEMHTIEVFSFRKTGDSWRLLLSGKLANFAQTARFNTEQAK